MQAFFHMKIFNLESTTQTICPQLVNFQKKLIWGAHTLLPVKSYFRYTRRIRPSLLLNLAWPGLGLGSADCGPDLAKAEMGWRILTFGDPTDPTN